jgi:L-fuconolactonase
MSRRIDAHHHFWRVERGDYHWMPDSGPLRRDYLPEDLAPLNEAAGIEGTILVQAAQTAEETKFLLGIAEQPGSTVLGVVCWAPLDSGETVTQLERLAENPKAVGVRPMLQDLAEVDWVTRPAVIESMRRLPRLGLRFDVLSYPEHLPYALRAVDQVPELDVVIDHLSKPRYGPEPREDWRRWMAEFARRPRVHCKLSGMVTEVGRGWTVDDFRAHAEFVLETFGPERVMFGSDWPVCLQAASHEEVVQLAEELTSQLGEKERAEVWGDTAARFYGV